jgi:tetratricopeptide (TPR) repeat protein
LFINSSTGKALMGKNKPILAVPCFDEALKLDPNYAAAYYQRALAYSQEGYNSKALKDLAEAIRLNPVNHDIYFMSGKLKLTQNRIEEALSDFDMSILLFHSFDNVNSHAYYYRGLCYQKLGNSEKAILDFSSNIALFPNFAPAYVGRGEEYNKLGQYSKAIEDYTTALYINDTKQTNSPDILLKRSEAYQKRNEAQDKHRALHVSCNIDLLSYSHHHRM